MQLSQVKSAVEATPKGANIILEWVRPCKVKKSVTDNITKSVRMVGRLNVEYDNLKAVQAKRENGELPAENGGLPWGFWAEHPWLVGNNPDLPKDHPEKSMVRPSTLFYIRLYKGTSDKVHPECHFFRNGIEVSKESLDNEILSSEKDSEKGETFTCKIENMTRIHSESEWVMIVVGQVGQEKVAASVPVPASTLATMQ